MSAFQISDEVIKIRDIIIADLMRGAPMSGSEFIYDPETGCMDVNGVFRPIEIAQRIFYAIE